MYDTMVQCRPQPSTMQLNVFATSNRSSYSPVAGTIAHLAVINTDLTDEQVRAYYAQRANVTFPVHSGAPIAYTIVAGPTPIRPTAGRLANSSLPSGDSSYMLFLRPLSTPTNVSSVFVRGSAQNPGPALYIDPAMKWDLAGVAI